MMSFDEYTRYHFDMDEYTAELLRSMDKRFRAGPQPIPGEYRMTHGREVSKLGIAAYATGFVSTRAATTIAMQEIMRTPVRNIGASYDSETGIVTMTTDDGFYYPFKGVVDYLAEKL